MPRARMACRTHGSHSLPNCEATPHERSCFGGRWACTQSTVVGRQAGESSLTATDSRSRSRPPWKRREHAPRDDRVQLIFSDHDGPSLRLSSAYSRHLCAFPNVISTVHGPYSKCKSDETQHLGVRSRQRFDPMRHRLHQKLLEGDSIASHHQRPCWLKGLHKGRRPRMRLRGASALHLDGGECATGHRPAVRDSGRGWSYCRRPGAGPASWCNSGSAPNSGRRVRRDDEAGPACRRA